MAKDEFLTGATYPKSNWSGVTPYLPMTNRGPILEWYRGYLLSLLYPKNEFHGYMDRHFLSSKLYCYTILFFFGLIPAMIQPVFHGCQAFLGGFGCPSNGPLRGDVKAFMNAQMPLGGGKKASPLRPRKLKRLRSVGKKESPIPLRTRWWFQICFIFIPTWGRWSNFD